MADARDHRDHRLPWWERYEHRFTFLRIRHNQLADTFRCFYSTPQLLQAWQDLKHQPRQREILRLVLAERGFDPQGNRLDLDYIDYCEREGLY